MAVFVLLIAKVIFTSFMTTLSGYSKEALFRFDSPKCRMIAKVPLGNIAQNCFHWTLQSLISVVRCTWDRRYKRV